MQFRVLATAEELELARGAIEEAGGKMPAEGQGVIFAQFDDAEVVAFQVLWTRAVFAEGLWAKDSRAHLLRLWGMMRVYLRQLAGDGPFDFLTMVRGDEQGGRIGAIAERLGCEPMDWKVYRRRF